MLKFQTISHGVVAVVIWACFNFIYPLIFSVLIILLCAQFLPIFFGCFWFMNSSRINCSIISVPPALFFWRALKEGAEKWPWRGGTFLSEQPRPRQRERERVRRKKGRSTTKTDSRSKSSQATARPRFFPSSWLLFESCKVPPRPQCFPRMPDVPLGSVVS